MEREREAAEGQRSVLLGAVAKEMETLASAADATHEDILKMLEQYQDLPNKDGMQDGPAQPHHSRHPVAFGKCDFCFGASASTTVPVPAHCQPPLRETKGARTLSNERAKCNRSFSSDARGTLSTCVALALLTLQVNPGSLYRGGTGT